MKNTPATMSTRTARTPAKKRRGGRRATHTLANIHELVEFKYLEKKKLEQGKIPEIKTGNKEVKKIKDGGTGKTYLHIERYVIKEVRPRDEEVEEVEDVGGGYFRLRIVEEDLQWEGYDGDKFEFDGVKYWLYYMDPTIDTVYNLLPVLPVDVDMDVSSGIPPPNGHFLRLVYNKCVHVLATTDILDNKGNHRDNLKEILNKFFLTKCDLYLPAGTDDRWEEMKTESQALKLQYQQAGNVVVETVEEEVAVAVAVADNGEEQAPAATLPAAMFSRLEFEDFQTNYMKESASFQAFMKKVDVDIGDLKDRMSTAETNIDTATKKAEGATKKAEGAIDMTNSLAVEFNEFKQKIKQKMSEPTAIQRVGSAMAELLYWTIIIAMVLLAILLAYVLTFKTYYNWFFI